MIVWTVAAISWSFVLALFALIVMQRGEIRYLREQIEKTREHTRRIERFDAGLPEEAPPKPEPDAPPPGIQTRMDEAIGAWGSAETQRQKWQDVNGWRSEGRSWDWICSELESEAFDE